MVAPHDQIAYVADVKVIQHFGATTDAFLKVAGKMRDSGMWWALLGATWMSADHLAPGYMDEHRQFAKLFRRSRRGQKWLMTEAEQRLLAGMPETLSVWRAARRTEEICACWGWSWTLSQQIAAEFCIAKTQRYGDEHVIFKAEVYRDDVLAFLNRHGQQEILIDPVFIPEVVELYSLR